MNKKNQSKTAEFVNAADGFINDTCGFTGMKHKDAECNAICNRGI